MNATDHAPLLERAFELPPKDASYAIESVVGRVPDYLRGSFYLNGPARFQRGDLRYRHWLDGDGLVCCLRFEKSGVHFTGRYVRSAKFLQEEEEEQAVFRTFGTSFDGDQLKRGIALESPVNVSVYPFRDSLLAFGEQGLPWELDPITLETRGEYNFDRRLNPISPFSAHPHFDPSNGDLFNFGVSFAARRPCLHFYRFTAQGESVYRQRLHLDEPRSVHDFALSPSYGVFYLSPYILDVEVLMGDGATLMEALTWRPEARSQLLLANREDGKERARIDIGQSYCLHLIDCHEENGLLAVDVLELDQPVYDQYQVPGFFTDSRKARPARYVVDPESGKLVDKITLAYTNLCDFPTIDPRRVHQKNGRFWFLGISDSDRPGRKFFDELVRCSWSSGGAEDRYSAPPKHYLCGEPVFLPAPRRRDVGSIICQSYDAENRKSAFLIFDANDLQSGPVATLQLREPIHLGFHACWAPEP